LDKLGKEKQQRAAQRKCEWTLRLSAFQLVIGTRRPIQRH